MCGVCSYMGWTYIPDIGLTASSAEDNPLAAPNQKPVGKVNVNLPTGQTGQFRVILAL